MKSRFGVVLIGRNEGLRLKHCIESIVQQIDPSYVIYVDSKSKDESVKLAKQFGVGVICLDSLTPFSAARARNEGFAALLINRPGLEFVQFIDGDCQLACDWLLKGEAELLFRPNLGIVCGRRREKFPNKSIYNRLCDIEWNTPIGGTNYCGGDFMIRTSAFKQVNGFNPNVIAGEEPELCVRLRKQGWKIKRIDADMTFHDANMTYFSQWWKRSIRSGFAYAQGMMLHGSPPDYHWVKDSLRIWFWSFILPILIILLILKFSYTGFLMLLIYPFSLSLFYFKLIKSGKSRFDSLIYSLACVLIKFPQLQGQIKFFISTFFKTKKNLIEYK